MPVDLSEDTVRQIVKVAAETLGEHATADNVKAVVSGVLEQLQQTSGVNLAPADSVRRQKFYTELLGDWLRSVEKQTTPGDQPIPASVQQTEPGSANFIVTVLGKDRPGIIAKVSAVLAMYNCSIMDMSQQILSGYFTVIMVVNLKGCTVDFAVLRDKLIQTGEELGVKILVQHQDVFEYMHRV